MEYHQPQKEQNFAICYNMHDLEDILTKSEKDKYCMISLTCGI